MTLSFKALSFVIAISISLSHQGISYGQQTGKPRSFFAADYEKKIAAVGHDTEKYLADDKVYEKLPGCCHYERKKAEKKSDSNN